jgi:hypothetical protein
MNGFLDTVFPPIYQTIKGFVCGDGEGRKFGDSE